MGLFDKAKEMMNEHNQKVAAEEAAEETANAEWDAKYNAVVITTGDLKRPYEVMDTVFAMDSSEAGFFSSANPTAAFQALNGQLRSVAASAGADAIIACQFEYRNAYVDGTFGGTNQVIELFAYGTAVKYTD
jgi:uncharacterized protein YbjQ (UPF0145 family)